MPEFCRYIGIDYSGAETPNASLKGLRVYLAQDAGPATEVLPPPSPRKYWTRKGIAEWLEQCLSEASPTIVGIDHGFSFPIRYFEAHHIPPEWDIFLDDFRQHWPTDQDHMYVDFIRDGHKGNGLARQGNSRWRRICETRCKAKSVFHFDVQGSVAKSMHAGIPWLLCLRQQCPNVHFWPFDGWLPSKGRSVVAEAYPSLWRHAYPTEERTPDQHDAYTIATGLQQADRTGTLASLLIGAAVQSTSIWPRAWILPANTTAPASSASTSRTALVGPNWSISQQASETRPVATSASSRGW